MNDKELVKKEENASGGTEDSSSKKVTAWKIAAFENNRLRPDDILAFSCDNCGEKFTRDVDNFHCKPCGFDLCMRCFKQSQY